MLIVCLLMLTAPLSMSDVPHQVRGPVPVGPDGNPTPGRRKWNHRHEAKIVSEVTEDDDDDNESEDFSAVYEHKV